MFHKIAKRYPAILILALGSGFILAGCGGSDSKEPVTVTIKPSGGGPAGQSGFFMLPAGGEVTFKAEVSGTLNKEVTWKVLNGNGEITPDFSDSSKAIYRAPASLSFIPSDFIEARSVDDPSAFENATVTLTQFLGPLRQPLSSTGTDEVILGALQINPSTSINLNGDVFNDLVARNRSQDKITFLVGLLNGFLLKPVVVSNPVAMVVGDFINEAQFVADIAALRVSPSGNDIVFISGGADDPTSFSPGLHPTTFPLPVSDGTPTLLAVGKYHESLPTNPNAPVSDLAVGTAEGDIAILLQNRNAPVPVSFNRSSSSPLSTGGTPTQLLSGDYNGDELGLDDLAVVRNNQSDLIIFIANSSGDFSGPLTVPTPSPIKSVVTADFNGDGIADLVAAHAAPPQLTVLLGIGDGGFAPAGTISLDSPPGAMAVGDFNFGGAADLAVALPDQGSILILFGDGTGQFIGKWLSPTTASPPPSLVAGCFIGTCANTGAQNFGLTYIEQSPSSTDQLVLLNNSIGPNNNP